MQDKCDKNYLLNKATRLIMRRLHSKQEIYQKLYKVCQNQETINMVIEELLYLNLLDDKIFAEAYTYELFTKKYGQHKVKEKLYRRGIGKDLSNLTIAEVLENNNINQATIIKDLLSKKALDLSDYNDRTKAIRYLISRGFDMVDIKQAIRDLGFGT